MEKVKVVKIFDVRTGVSRSSGKEWKSRDVLLESVQNVMALHHDVNDKNGRCFNEVRIVEFGNNL